MKIESFSRPFDLIIFDLGSTLIFFNADWEEVLNRAEQSLVDFIVDQIKAIDKDQFKLSLHNTLMNYYQQREIDLVEASMVTVLCSVFDEYGIESMSDAFVKEALLSFYSISQEQWFIEDDSIATLEYLKDNNYRLAILSNAGDDDDVMMLVKNAQLTSYFEHVITSAKVGFRKPDPRIYQELLNLMDVPASRAAMVGDTLNADIKGAQNVGIYSIWIKRRADRSENWEHENKIIPDATISVLGELPLLLENLR